MKPNFKEIPLRSMKYLKYVRSQPCCVCGVKNGIQAHHETPKGQGGMGTKTGDDHTLPLCHFCHRKRHDHGRTMWERWGVDPQVIIADLNRAYEMRGEMKEICSECGEETGKAGRHEDSLYLTNNIVNKEVGPLCEDCYSNFLQDSEYTNKWSV